MATTPRERDRARFAARFLEDRAADALRRIEARPVWRPKEGNIYFLLSSVGPIKIGFAVDVARRVKDLRNMNPGELTIAAVVPGPISLETEYHRRFAAHRLHGEWFERHPDILAEIDRLNERPARQASSEALTTRTDEVRYG